MSRRQKLHDQQAATAFREWTRGTSFNLAMGKAQVATLVSLHASKNMVGHVGSRHRLLRSFIVYTRCLQDRGLLIHRAPKPYYVKQPWGEIFVITEAGEHVVALLQLTGIYDEVLSELTASDMRERLA